MLIYNRLTNDWFNLVRAYQYIQSGWLLREEI
jgi:hypothetical protein